jgi:hypothetical protein
MLGALLLWYVSIANVLACRCTSAAHFQLVMHAVGDPMQHLLRSMRFVQCSPGAMFARTSVLYFRLWFVQCFRAAVWRTLGSYMTCSAVVVVSC